ncbi:hypothetical protein HU230_0034735 [Bradyrhizobium quebecense]|uniref:LysR substrate-binding domain-containing protein n=1 Tax=Bradyrhizobium quebecense TaxID=2748629 RepID=A0A974ADY0_9BRAD|nr:hypothetical protein [Bradyrhizobium quebecense]UGA43371.1 hypothetical protein HU230_0034735 [Bradyrhizobium quebecense]
MQSGGRRCGSVAAIVAPSYLQALHIAAETDLVAFVPSRLASLLVHRLNLMIVKPPFNPGVDEQFLFYPATAQRDRGSLWFRSLMMKISKPDRPDRPRR